MYPLALAAVWGFWRASGRCSAQPRLRSAWRLLALGGLCCLAGDLAQSIYELSGPLPFPSVADLLFLAFYPLTLWGLLRASPPFPTPRERVRFALDLAVVGISAAAIMLFAVVGINTIGSDSHLVKTITSVCYPAGDAILLIGVGSLLLRGTDRSSRLAFVLLGAGLLFWIVGDVVYSYIQLHSTYHDGDPVDALWMVAVALFVLAGPAQQRAKAAGPTTSRRFWTPANWLPFTAVGAVFALIVVETRGSAAGPADRDLRRDDRRPGVDAPVPGRARSPADPAGPASRRPP